MSLKPGTRSEVERVQGQQKYDHGDASTTLSAHVTREPERRHFGANDAHTNVDGHAQDDDDGVNK